MTLPLFVGALRVEALGGGGALLGVAGVLVLRGRVEIERARRAYVEGRRLHAVRVDRGEAR